MKNLSPRKKKYLIIASILVLIGIIGVISEAVNPDSDVRRNMASQQKAREAKKKAAKETHKEEPKKKDVAKLVKKALDDSRLEGARSTMADTGPEGYLGEVEKVENRRNNGDVVVTVSTYFNDPKDGPYGGQTIARRIMAYTCIDIPELQSVYVTSKATGLDSRSAYRHQIPACASTK